MKINWKYTFGELLIVIVGILIAFGLNNWAQGKLEARKQTVYLKSLSADLTADLEVLSDNLVFVKRN